ncbi:septum formation family protein [Nocardiopsis ganjiahuensis]|uniref:septum formation family protein n=1 Tax=Nocardiopsis ganjiahuensis TaxID=239984 RepID=UPI0003457D78|nr:septum formation family protein [Nocardiopsis ganjiahuensis]
MSSLSPIVRNTSLAVLAAGAVVSLSACGLVNSLLGTGNVMNIAVGDCFDEAAMQTALGGEEVSNIPLIDCAEPHDAEVFHVEDLPDGEFPGDASVGDSMEEICTGSAFEEFVGVNYMDSAIHVGGLQPTAQTWDSFDDREILCYVISDEGPISESLQGANR